MVGGKSHNPNKKGTNPTFLPGEVLISMVVTDFLQVK